MDNTRAPGDSEIPRFVTYTSPVSILPSNNGEGVARATALPLNLIALIVSHLDDMGDIARVTRTCKLLYYMTLPQLYNKVSLHSYPEMRYINGRPEGFGGGSPFVMALNGLVTKSQAGVVHDFRVWGEWNELGVEDFAKGRVPDNAMMLNIIVRSAVDRMIRLRNFTWELDCKPLRTLYQGLGAHNTLTTLTIKFPNSRMPRPSVMIPPMVNLRAFKALDIDPLCYPDDISLMLLGSKKLEDLRMHFSPRMRREAESSLNLNTYFGRCLSANYQIPLKHLALQNFYGPSDGRASQLADHRTLSSICAFDTFGGMAGNVANKFYDDTWREIPKHVQSSFRSTRCNEPADHHARLLSLSKGHERFYMVNSNAKADNALSPRHPATPAGSPGDPESIALGKQYLYALTRFHGSTLRHLLLSDQWLLGEEDIADLVRYCPNLEQLGLAVIGAELCSFGLLLPFLPKLHSLRLLGNETMPEMQVGQRSNELGYHLQKIEATTLRYCGIRDRIFKIGGSVQDEGGRWRRDVKEVCSEDVKHVEIWGLDNLDISLDPVEPFSP